MSTIAPAANGASWAPVDGVAATLADRRARPGGRLYAAVRWGGAALFAGVFALLIFVLLHESSSAFAHMGITILWRGWNPAKNQYGAGVFAVGTLLTTLVALVIAVPIGLGTATFLAELAPRWVAAPCTVLVEFLAAVPSIVVGLWGLIVLTPLFARHVEPFLKDVPVLGALFHGPPLGASILLAGVVLAIMILPTIVALSRVAMSGVALADREAGMALAATRWQVARRVVLPGARRGIRAAVTLAMGRALGEAIAVAMVVGNNTAFPHSLLAPGATLGSAIVNSFSEANPGTLEKSGVVALVVVLLGISVLVNAGGQILLRARKGAPPPRGPVEEILAVTGPAS
ncbi:MAG TPA: phosphate ABC transporter permease subunit PstC [Acidimicrobiales bacterium]|nr:phosphate ABC transporter permease subunit PstC [Acidimicrobiales bacterium]